MFYISPKAKKLLSEQPDIDDRHPEIRGLMGPEYCPWEGQHALASVRQARFERGLDMPKEAKAIRQLISAVPPGSRETPPEIEAAISELSRRFPTLPHISHHLRRDLQRAFHSAGSMREGFSVTASSEPSTGRPDQESPRIRLTEEFVVAELATGSVSEHALNAFHLGDKHKTTCLVLKFIPAGSFMMGDRTGKGEVYERPVHKVTLTGDFYMGVFPVTQRQWFEMMGHWPSHFTEERDKLPVEDISWLDTQPFVERLIPFVVVTGSVGEHIPITMLTQGADNYVMKQNLERLIPAVEQSLEKAEEFRRRERTEEELRESEARYRALVQHAIDGILVADVETKKFVHANPAICRLLGYSTDELIRLGVADIHPPEALEDVLAEFEAQTSGRKEIAHEVPCVRKDGSVVYVDIAAASASLGGNRCAIGIFRDVTDRKQAEAELRRQRDFSDSLIQTAQSIVLVLDTEGRIVQFNPYMEELSGYRLDEVRGKDWFDTFLPGRDHERIKSVFEKARSNVATRGIQNAIIAKDGSEILIEWYDKTLRDADENIVGVLAIGQDITERRLLEIRLRQSEKVEAIGRLASGVAHEINNPLNALMNYAQLIVDRVQGDTELAGFADEIINEGQRVATIVGGLLDFARQDSNEAFRGSGVKEIIDSSLALFLTTARKESILVECAVSEGLPKVRCRGKQIQQVLLNLLLNARDALIERHGPHLDEVTIKLYVRLMERDGQRYVRFTVEDRGRGVPEEILNRVFDPFFTTKPAGKGTGLGLSICQGIVKEHDGEIEIESHHGEGTSVHVELPVAEEASGKVEDDMPVAGVQSHAESPPTVGASRILLVDDEERLREFVSESLHEFGHQVQSAGNGKTAIEHYRESWQNTDLVILDMVMPGMGGWKTFVEMRKINPQIKAILVSGYGLSEEVRQFLKEGALAFLQKPFSVAELLAALEEVLKR